MRAQLLTLCLALAVAGSIALGQYDSFNQRDDRYRLLGLKRAKEYFEVTKREYERQQLLYDKGLLSVAELERAGNAMADAEVNYQQSLLAVLFEQQYVSIGRAVKYQDPDGRKRVRLSLVNASGGTEEFQKLLGIDDALFRHLQPDVISSIYVSIYNDEGAIISQPYEVKVEDLRAGRPREVDFGLLHDLDAVTVNIIYGNGSSRTLKIVLQKDNSANTVAVQSQQFSQEAELGKTATFDLTLELYSGTTNTFSLETLNLPEQINRTFRDVRTNARMTQIKFTESSNSRTAALEVSLPDRPTEQVAMDRVIPFFVVIVPAERRAELIARGDTLWTEQEIRALDLGYVRLELMPRGKGRLLVRAPQLYHAVGPDGSVEMSVDVVNEGSRRTDNVMVEVDVPLNWTREVEPRIIPSLAINDEQQVVIRATPPPGVSVGRYELRLRTSGLSDNQPVNADDKTVTVEVQAGANVLGTLLLVVAILGLVAGMVIYGLRLARR